MHETNFRTYEQAIEFYRECTKLRLKGCLRDQLHRASLSVVLNLAEGAAKPTKADKKRFYAIAYGSIRESQALCRVIDNPALFKRADQIGAMTYRLMRSQ
jgi:four helix bundle protein